MTLSPSVCCGFTASFNSFQVFLSPRLPEHPQTTFTYWFSCFVETVLFPHQCFFTFCVGLTVLCISRFVVVVAPVLCMWYYVHLILLFSLCFSLTEELMFLQVLLRNTLNCLRRWKAQTMALTRWLNILQNEVCWKNKQQKKRVNEPDAFRLHSLKACGFPWRKTLKSLRNANAKTRHFDLVVCYVAFAHGELVILWAQAWPRPMNQIRSKWKPLCQSCSEDSKQLSL